MGKQMTGRELKVHRQKRHRVAGHYLALQAWMRRLDCIVLVREELEVFLDRERIRKEHVEHFATDVAPWFPHTKVFYLETKARPVNSLFLSRFPFPKSSSGSLETKARIAMINRTDGAPKTGRFSERKDANELPSHEKMVAYLNALAGGSKVSPLKSEIKAARLSVMQPVVFEKL
ncbi:MAG TPA: hypothetical protein VGB76_14115 [Pyrinomonadaceae bacterium]